MRTSKQTGSTILKTEDIRKVGKAKLGKVVSLINWKGGVGKSTLTLHLGVGLQKKTNRRVLIVDLDPQCNLSFLALGVDSYVNRVYKSKTKTLKNVFDSYFNDGAFDVPNIVQKS